MMKPDELIETTLESIRPADDSAVKEAREYVSSLAAPPGSLGVLTDMAVRMAGITGRLKNDMKKRRVIVCCADNGVTAKGVSVTPVPVTAKQAVNMTKRLTGMSAMAKEFGIDVTVADIGIATPYECSEIVDLCVRKGTADMSEEAAMTRKETEEAIGNGILLAKKAMEDGMDAVGVGEMGIGNTTTSAAVLSALTGADVETVTGRGGGLTDEAFVNKKRVIRDALKMHSPDAKDVTGVLSKVGGLDLAAMCGVYLGCAAYRIPVVIDGFISSVAALCAYRMKMESKDFMFPSHSSKEPGAGLALDEIGLKPYLDLNMRLGEGSGCIPAFLVMECSSALMQGMATFDAADIDDAYLEEIR